MAEGFEDVARELSRAECVMTSTGRLAASCEA